MQSQFAHEFGRRSGVPNSRQSCLRNLTVGARDLVAHVATPILKRGDRGRARPHERVQDDVVLEGIELDQPMWQFWRKRGGVLSLPRGLRAEGPDALGVRQELVSRNRALLAASFRSPEGRLTEDEDVLVGIAQRGI